MLRSGIGAEELVLCAGLVGRVGGWIDDALQGCAHAPPEHADEQVGVFGAQHIGGDDFLRVHPYARGHNILVGVGDQLDTSSELRPR